MSQANEYKYNVIQFAEAPYKDVADYVCVPSSWVHARGPNDRKVRVSYPVENPLDTEKRVRKRKKKSDEWKSYLSVIKHYTDDYDDANRYIQRMQWFPESPNADNTLPSTNFEEKPRRSTRKATLHAKMNLMEVLELSPSSKTTQRSTNTTTLKRKGMSDPDEDSYEKRSRMIEPDKFEDEVAEIASKANEVTSEDQSLPHEDSYGDLCTPETPVDLTNYGNISENIPTINHSLSEANHHLDPEIVGRFVFKLQELQACIALVDNAITKIKNNVNGLALVTAWQHSCPSPPSSENTEVEEPKLKERKGKEEHANGKDTDDDDEDQPLKKLSDPKRIKKVVLPPEYVKNDTTWTLKYREPATGLVELMEHSGVYVNALELAKCKRMSKDSKTLARMVLIEIFTTSALGTCSWTGGKAKAFRQDVTDIRPGLDGPARSVLMNYVAEHAKKEGWCFENASVLNSIRNKMQEMRAKYKYQLCRK